MKNIIKSWYVLLALLLALPALAEKEAAEKVDDSKKAEIQLEKLKLPGVTFNVKEQYIDVDSVICLDAGALELIACAKNTKEHEAILMVEAKPVHIHTALLLIGATPGNPAMRKQIGEGEEKRWMHLPPRGGPVKVSVVIAGEDGKEVVRPITDFIQRIAEDPIFPDKEIDKEEIEPFPTDTFLFTGSHLIDQGDGPRKYLAGDSGNVISISTFGDEMLGLPEVIGHGNDGLVWEINPTHLPAIGTKVKIRMQPVR